MKKYASILALSCLVSASAMAQQAENQGQSSQKFKFANSKNFAYNFVEGDLVDQKDADGIGFKGSFDIQENIAIIGSYTTVSVDRANIDVDLLTIGAAYHQPLSVGIPRPTDLVLHAEIARYDVSYPAPFSDDSDTGLKIGAEGRLQLLNSLEVFVDVSYITADNGNGSDLIGTAGGRFEFAPNFMAIASLEVISDTDQFTVGLRYNF